MGRYLGPACRLCRREQMKLFLKGEKCFTKCTLDKRPNPPGQKTTLPSPMRVSVYAKRMREKQKLKRMAGISETQMKNYYKKAKKSKIQTGLALLQLLERRLDNIVYRMGITPSRKAARQLITHGHIFVNGKKVKSPGYQIKTNDEIELREKMKTNKHILLTLEKIPITPPDWIEFNRENLKAKILRIPNAREDFSYPINESLIVEFYSR